MPHKSSLTVYTQEKEQNHTLGLFVLSFFNTGPAKLKEVVSERDVAVIARDLMTKWETLRRFLDLTQPDEEAIRQTYRDYGKQKEECLEKWKQTKGNQATYGALIAAADDTKDKKLADGVRKMIGA